MFLQFFFNFYLEIPMNGKTFENYKMNFKNLPYWITESMAAKSETLAPGLPFFLLRKYFFFHGYIILLGYPNQGVFIEGDGAWLDLICVRLDASIPPSAVVHPHSCTTAQGRIKAPHHLLYINLYLNPVKNAPPGHGFHIRWLLISLCAHME